MKKLEEDYIIESKSNIIHTILPTFPLASNIHSDANITIGFKIDHL